MWGAYRAVKRGEGTEGEDTVRSTSFSHYHKNLNSQCDHRHGNLRVCTGSSRAVTDTQQSPNIQHRPNKRKHLMGSVPTSQDSPFPWRWEWSCNQERESQQTIIYKRDKQQGPTVEHRELYSIS